MTEHEAQLSRKNDRRDNKPRWELLPLPTLEEVVKVYTMGARKYGENTWQNLPDGMARYKAAMLRHLVAYDRGERKDAESGLSPLAHVAWNAIAMLYIELQGQRALESSGVVELFQQEMDKEMRKAYDEVDNGGTPNEAWPPALREKK